MASIPSSRGVVVFSPSDCSDEVAEAKEEKKIKEKEEEVEIQDMLYGLSILNWDIVFG